VPDEIIRAALDPTAPLPAAWPTGALGAFLLFLFPIGGGIPLGVVIARDGGVSPFITALLYLVSDLFAAITNEPLLLLLAFLGRRFAFIGWLGQRFKALSSRVGYDAGGARGPLSLIVTSFSVSLLSGRAAAAAAGHGFLAGWSIAITGDMLYFALLMVSTLWLSSVLGNERLAVGVVLVGTLLLPFLVKRLRRPPPEPVFALAGSSLRPSIPSMWSTGSMRSIGSMTSSSEPAAAAPTGALSSSSKAPSRPANRRNRRHGRRR
jgi:hypothetical protein